MKISDLYRRYAGVIDLCEGTQVNPNSCVRQLGVTLVHKLVFTGAIETYEFALAIVEGKPVFAGDVLWINVGFGDPIKITVKKAKGEIVYAENFAPSAHISNLTWNPPKKDEYAELKRAQSKGEKIAWFSDEGVWYVQGHRSDKEFAQHPVERWKVVEDDLVIEYTVSPFSSEIVRIKLTKSGLDGKIRAEVI